jgi:hypothetical protein
MTSIHRRPAAPEDRRIRLHVEPVYERPEAVPCSPESPCRTPSCLPCLERDIAYLQRLAETGEPTALSIQWHRMRREGWTAEDVRADARKRLAAAEAELAGMEVRP